MMMGLEKRRRRGFDRWIEQKWKGFLGISRGNKKSEMHPIELLIVFFFVFDNRESEREREIDSDADDLLLYTFFNTLNVIPQQIPDILGMLLFDLTASRWFAFLDHMPALSRGSSTTDARYWMTSNTPKRSKYTHPAAKWPFWLRSPLNGRLLEEVVNVPGCHCFVVDILPNLWRREVVVYCCWSS